MFFHYIKTAIRNIEKHWPQFLIGILGISFAVTCFVLSLYWIRYETTYDGFYPDAQSIYRVYTFEKESGKINKGASKVMERKLCEKYPNIQASTTLMRGEENCSTQEIPHIKMRYLYADNSFFQVFRQKIILGDMQPLSVMNNLVLTETMAKRLFGSVDKAIGQQVQSKMREDLPPYTVTAVVQDPPANTNLAFDGLVYHNMLKSFSDMPEEIQWSIRFMEVYAKFNAHTDMKEVKIQARDLPAELKANSNIEIRMINLLDVRHELEGKSPFTLNFIRLFIISGILLLISALFNFFNLYFDLQKQRVREFNLRSVNGATRRQLIFQLLVELICPTVLALALSNYLVMAVCPSFSNLLDLKIPFYDLALLSLECTLLIAIAMFFVGFFLFLRLINESLSLKVSCNNHSPLYRRMAVSLQLFVSMIFIVVALIVMRQMNYLNKKDLGLESEGLIQLSGFVDYSGKIENKLIDKIKTIPQVLSVSDANFEPKHEADPTYMTNEVKWPGAPTESPLFNILFADSYYAEALHLTMSAGNWWKEGQTTKVVLNEEAARRMELDNPVETVIQLPSEADRSVMADYEIVGVVKDFHTLSFRNPISAMIFVPSSMYKFNILYIRTGDGQESETIKNIREILPSVDPSLTDIHLIPVTELYNRLNRSEQIGLKIFSALAFTCLLISLFGIYAVSHSSTQRRRKEIAIRKVLGAEAREIVWIFFKEYISHVIIAGLFALPIAYLIMRNWLQDYAYRTNMPLWLLLGVVIGVVLLVVMTILKQVISVANRNPAVEIKRE